MEQIRNLIHTPDLRINIIWRHSLAWHTAEWFVQWFDSSDPSIGVYSLHSYHASHITCIWLVNLRNSRLFCHLYMKFLRLPRSLGQPNYQLYSIVITKFIYISYSTHKYSMKFTNIIVINITRYAYLHAFASFFQKPLLNKGNKVIMWIIIMCVSVCLGIRNTACCRIFICVCLVLAKTPIKVYSRMQLLCSICYTVCVSV